jgi:hypothetical protein
MSLLYIHTITSSYSSLALADENVSGTHWNHNRVYVARFPEKTSTNLRRNDQMFRLD